jgi:hypothetical protein
MAKILYATNSTRGQFDGRCNFQQFSKYKNLAYYLCESGHDVSVLIETNSRAANSILNQCFHSKCSPELINITDLNHKKSDTDKFCNINFLTLPFFLNKINTDEYDLILMDSSWEFRTRPHEEWHHVLQYLKSSDEYIFDCLSEILPLNGFLANLDLPSKKTTLNPAGLQTFFPLHYVDQFIKPYYNSLEKFYQIQLPLSKMQSIFKSKKEQDKNDIIESFFTPAGKDTKSRLHFDSYLTSEENDSLELAAASMKFLRLNKKGSDFYKIFSTQRNVGILELISGPRIKTGQTDFDFCDKQFVPEKGGPLRDLIFECHRLTQLSYAQISSQIENILN